MCQALGATLGAGWDMCQAWDSVWAVTRQAWDSVWGVTRQAWDTVGAGCGLSGV